MKKNLRKVFDRIFIYYIVVGIINFIVCTALMFFLFNICGFSEDVAPLFNYGLGSLIWYLACKYLLFRNQKTTWEQTAKFLLEVAICYVISYYLCAPFLTEALLRYPSVWRFFSFGGDEQVMVSGNCSMTIGMVVYAVLNYFGQRYLVFNDRFEYHRRNKEKKG